MRRMYFLQMAALLVLAATPPPLGIAAFQDRLADAVRAAVPTAKVDKLDQRTLRISGPAGVSSTMAVENAYREYLTDPAKLEFVLAKWAHITADTGQKIVKADAARLVVVIRPKRVQLQAGQSGAMITAPFAGDLLQVLALDSPESLRYVSVANLHDIGLTAGAAFARGRANIKARIGTINLGQVTGAEYGLTGVGAASGLGTGMLVNDSFCGPTHLSGTQVLVVNRDAFAFGIEDDPLGMAAFRRFVAKTLASANAFSRTPLRCVEGHWQV